MGDGKLLTIPGNPDAGAASVLTGGEPLLTSAPSGFEAAGAGVAAAASPVVSGFGATRLGACEAADGATGAAIGAAAVPGVCIAGAPADGTNLEAVGAFGVAIGPSAEGVAIDVPFDDIGSA